MFERIWREIQRTFTKMSLKRFGKRTVATEISLQEAWSRVHRVLVCWPGYGMDVIAARVVLNRCRDRFPDAHLTVMALPGVGASPPGELDAEVINVSRADLTLFGIPRKRLRDQLKERGFDLAVDLSPSFEPLAAYLCLASEALFRIGFAGPGGDVAYNYQVAPRSDRSGIDRYRVLARYIG